MQGNKINWPGKIWVRKPSSLIMWSHLVDAAGDTDIVAKLNNGWYEV